MGRTIFIGDVHGCADELRALLDVLDIKPKMDHIYLTGDAFTKGPDPLGVWTIIDHLGVDMVMGNHDAALLDRLKTRINGHEKKMKPAHKKTLDAVMPVMDDLVAWIENLPLYIETEGFLLVHAGIHPQKELLGTSRDEFLTIRTWPPQKGIDGPRWYDVYQPIRPLLVFGHDAPKGLVVKKRKDKPYLVGLDSGCVYGNVLSAFVVEDAQIVQVKSGQPKQLFD
jgi:serine/threonine protein phosphatase 1